MNRQLVLSFLCILFGYLIFGTYALSLRAPFDFPIEIYWLSFVLVSIPLFCEVLFWRDNPKLRLFYLLCFSLMINLQYAVVDFSPLMTSSDAIADYRLTNKIITDSNWIPANLVEWFFGSEYRFYPVTNFIYATTSLSTGIPLIFVVKYLFLVKSIILPPIANKLFRSFFDSRVAYLATIFFLSSPGAIIFPHKESFAIIFFFLCLYVISRIQKNRKFLVICFITTLTLFMTHHFTSYIFLGLLTSLYIGQYIFKGKKTFRVSTQYVILSWVILVAWITFVAWAVFSFHQDIVFNLVFGSLFSGELAPSELLSLSMLYERIIIYIGYGITLVSTGLGFLFYIRNKKSRSSEFLVFTLFFLPILALATIFRFSGSTEQSILISHRVYEFGYIVIGAFSALFFIHIIQKMRTHKKLIKSLILICPLVFIMLVGPMAGAMHPRTLARLGEVISYNGLSLNTWMGKSGASDEYIVCDYTMQIIFSGYGDSKTIISSELFYSQNLTFPEDASYVATYTYMTDFYGTNLKEFDNSPYLHNVYSNGIINIYKISNHPKQS